MTKLLIEYAQLLVEAALLRRFNAGAGFADPRLPSQMYLLNAQLAGRLTSGLVRAKGTHRQAADENAKLLAAVRTSLAEPLADAVVAPASASAATSAAAATCRPAFGSLRLGLLGARFALDPISLEILAVLWAAELDPDTRTMLRAAAMGSTAVPATVFVELLGVDATAAIAHAVGLGGKLATARLLDLEGVGLGATMVLRPAVVAWLAGDDAVPEFLAEVCTLTSRAECATTLLTAATQADLAAAASMPDRHDVVVGIVGPTGSGRRATAVAFAAAHQRAVLAIDLAAMLAREPKVVAQQAWFADALAMATLLGAMPLLENVDAAAAPGNMPGNMHLARSVPGTLLVSATTPAGLPAVAGRVQHVIRIAPATVPERQAAWQHALQNQPHAVIAPATLAYCGELASRYVLGAGAIAQVVAEVAASCRLRHLAVEPAAVEAAVARKLALQIGAFGAVVKRKATLGELVVPDDVRESLGDMIAMVHKRSQILEAWGFANHLGISRGVSALFSGEPGTGKTMAASAIAGELGLELVRIDLSTVVSKFVGETEKNLGRIFDMAQQAHALLLFDEADSLFGKRTELRSAQDRFANLEVNYILQRMETFDGMSILTTNAENAIDQALQRRLNFRIRFPEPTEDEREILWRTLLPPQAERTGDIDFRALADRYVMTGGYIKNAIVRAAVIAARDNRPIGAADIWQGADAEYAEMGKVMPQTTPSAGRRSTLQ